LLKIIYIVCQVKNNAIYGGRIYVFIGKTIGVNSEQMMEFVSKNERGFAPIEKRHHNF